jgi:transposase
MSKKRRTFTPEFRAKVALAALRGQKTINQIASEFELHPVQVTQWKQQALEGLPASLEDRRGKGAKLAPGAGPVCPDRLKKIWRARRPWLSAAPSWRPTRRSR